MAKKSAADFAPNSAVVHAVGWLLTPLSGQADDEAVGPTLIGHDDGRPNDQLMRGFIDAMPDRAARLNKFFASEGTAVWIVAVEDIPPGLWPRLAALLDVTEQRRVGRFACERHRRQYVAAHALKRLMLTLAAGGVATPTAWVFETGTHGKPVVAGGAGPHFNLAHCDRLVACAVNWRSPLGVDVENLGRRASPALAERFFAPAEQAWLRGLPMAERASGLLTLWTLKEAYIKATGLGLAQPLRDFAFHFEPLRVAFADTALGDPSAWRFISCRVRASYSLAMAWRPEASDGPVEIAAVRLEALMDGKEDALTPFSLDEICKAVGDELAG